MKTEDDNDRLLTAYHVSFAIGKSTVWLRRQRKKKTGIPYLRVGRQIRYRESDMLRWIEDAAKKRTKIDCVYQCELEDDES